MQPMKLTAGTMFTRRKAKVTPTASASMLVATASGSMVLKSKRSLDSFSSSLLASRIMLKPINANRTKAIQWSMLVIREENVMPRR